jgi:hypothetical protein
MSLRMGAACRSGLLSRGGGDGIWDEFYYDKGQNVSGRPLEGFFVGSEQEYDRGLAAEPRPWIFVPPIGPQTP